MCNIPDFRLQMITDICDEYNLDKNLVIETLKKKEEEKKPVRIKVYCQHCHSILTEFEKKPTVEKYIDPIHDYRWVFCPYCGKKLKKTK